MSAYKKIVGTSIRPQGGKPANGGAGVVGHVGKGVHVKGSVMLQGAGKEGFFMGKGASGPKTVKCSGQRA